MIFKNNLTLVKVFENSILYLVQDDYIYIYIRMHNPFNMDDFVVPLFSPSTSFLSCPRFECISPPMLLRLLCAGQVAKETRAVHPGSQRKVLESLEFEWLWCNHDCDWLRISDGWRWSEVLLACVSTVFSNLRWLILYWPGTGWNWVEHQSAGFSPFFATFLSLA